jgi:LAS superfamily LD-carboxypeptidase LdcB
VGGFDRKKQTISLHDYRTNKRLTQGAKAKDCRTLTWAAFRSWLVRETGTEGKGNHPAQTPDKERLLPPPLE